MKTVPKAGACRVLVNAGLCLLVSGCSEELGPTRFRTTVVKGKVREGTRPVSRGWIEFYPVDGTVGNIRSGPLKADGSFVVHGVAVGENLIRLENASIETPGAFQLFRSYGSPIRRKIADPQATPVEIDLVEELVRYQRTHGDSRSDPSRRGEAR